jgi:hypothetical protein
MENANLFNRVMPKTPNAPHLGATHEHPADPRRGAWPREPGRPEW